jgi:hypothetical protein
MNIAQKAFHALFSPPRSIPRSQNEDPHTTSANTRSARTSPRCEFTFSDGRQCRNQRTSLCAHHASKSGRNPGDAVAPDAGLEGLCGDLTTATNINRALAQVFLLMAQGRIPQKQAVAFGYLSQLLLQTVPGIRSEYVASFGYRSWEQKLKRSLEMNQNEDPNDSGGGGESPEQSINGVIEPQKAVPSRESRPSDQDGRPERRTGGGTSAEPASGGRVNKVTASFRHKTPIRPGSASRPPAKVYQQDELSPVNKVIVNEGTLCDPPPPPDYDSLYSRSLDLLDRRYDTTPEGRSEAKKLALELELMKPADSKPPKGYFGEVVSLVRRLRAHQQRKPAAAVNTPPPSPAPVAANAPQSSPTPAAANGPTPPSVPAAASAAPSNLPPPPVSRSEPSPSRTINKPEPPPVPMPDSALPAMAARQAARSPVTPAPSSAPSPAPPLPGITLTRTGHTTDWYAPASWSGNNAPDPFPSRQEKLKRDLRSMSSARWRHLQHLNSRAF